MKPTLKNNFSDEQIIMAFLQGETSSFEELYKRYHLKVYSKCLSMIQDAEDAADLAQEVLIKAYEKLDTFKGKSSFSTWLYSITSNHCIEFLRKKSRNTYVSVESISDEFIVEEIEDDKDSDYSSLLKVLMDELSAEERSLLFMKYLNGSSVKELEKMLDMKPSAIKMRLLRTRKKLNSIYSQKYAMPLSA